MSGQNEDILLQLPNVKYKKNKGALFLSAKRVGWRMEGEDVFQVTVNYTDIKSQKISQESKPKVQLQLIQYDQTAYTFQFVNPSGRDVQVQERNKIREHLRVLISQSKRTPQDELMEKKRVLEENPHLKELYMSLVRTEILTSDQFWKEIAGQYKEILAPKLDVGVSGAFLADIKPQTDGSNGRVLYNLTPEIMTSIFKTYPTVKKKHEEYVPYKMTDAEFWTRFFQSHYYSVHTNSRVENVFSECAKHDDKEWLKDLNTIQNDPLFDLCDIYEEKPLELESDLKPKGLKAGSNHIHATMIKRFNQHSLNILKAQTASEKEKISVEMYAENPEPQLNGHFEPELNLEKSKKARLDDKLQYEDLNPKTNNNQSSLVIHQKDRYLAGPPTTSVSNGVSRSNMSSLQHQLSCTVRQNIESLDYSANPRTSSQVLQGLAQDCLKRHVTSTKTGQELPKDLQYELSKVYISSGELLRHFWACFPPRTKELQEKLDRMHTTMSKYQQTTIRQLQELIIKNYNGQVSILDHLLELFQVAYSKYDSWKTRRC